MYYTLLIEKIHFDVNNFTLLIIGVFLRGWWAGIIDILFNIWKTIHLIKYLGMLTRV